MGANLQEVASLETGLPLARLQGETGRVTGQLRLFAELLRRGDFYGARIDVALPERKPLPRVDLRQYKVGVGPVAVFGASNFPLAFSTAGGDTVAALAAGCPLSLKHTLDIWRLLSLLQKPLKKQLKFAVCLKAHSI